MSVCATLQDVLALGAIFATTDSVAVLQVLDKDRSPILFSLVFGEGVINDAAGVALLRAIQVLTHMHIWQDATTMYPSDSRLPAEVYMSIPMQC